VRVLVVNAGSSSLKLGFVEDGRVTVSTNVERWQGAGDVQPVEAFLSDVGDAIDAVGHRVVHGGPRYAEPVRLDDPVDGEVVGYLDSIADLAPLHNPRAVAGIREVGRLCPDLPAVVAFDTGFHRTLPPAAATYALPREWNERWGLRRYGFHGLSHSWAVRRAAALVGRPVADLRIVSCHLGDGASLAADRGGRSVDTTMGFTPLAGRVMATRSGSVDPGLLTWLLEHGEVEVETLGSVLEHQSGLKGLSGTSGDLRDVLAGRAAGHPDCALAFDVFVHVLVQQIGGMTASAGGLDLLVFTGGIGEHSPAVRAAAVERLGHLGVALDDAANEAATGDAVVGPGDTAVVVVSAAEDVEVARLVEQVLAG
jgi:acetate kinase